MLIQLSTLLARARRSKKPALVCRVSIPDIISGCISAAEKQLTSLILLLDTAEESIINPETLIQFTRIAAEASAVPVAIAVLVKPEREAIETTLRWGAPGLLLVDNREIAWETWKEITNQAVCNARFRKAEVIGTVGSLILSQRLADFVSTTGVQAVMLPVVAKQNGKESVSLSYIKEASQAARVPLLAQECTLSVAQAKNALKAGLAGISIGEELAHAYTAGIRTGLRSRSVLDPLAYRTIGVKAVEQCARHYALSI